jgi:hypothetical protein
MRLLLAKRSAIFPPYCDYIWRNDLDGLVSLFTEDGTFTVEGLEVESISRARA